MDSVPARDPTRKASLDRILSPQVNRRTYFPSPNSQSGGLSVPVRDKSLSPVATSPGHQHNPLCTSKSNASIHSNYSEDSLTANGALSSSPYSAVAAAAAAASADHRWNSLLYEAPGEGCSMYSSHVRPTEKGTARFTWLFHKRRHRQERGGQQVFVPSHLLRT